MIIRRADTGVVFQVDADVTFTVDKLKDILVAHSGVPKEDQVLLCGGQKLERNFTLGHYGLPSPDKNVFLYDKKTTEPDAPSPAEVVLPPIELKVTPAPPLPQIQEWERSPILWALLKYENQFLNDLNTAEAMKKVVEARTDLCKNCIQEQETQAQGLEAAMANLNDQITQLNRTHKDFRNYRNSWFQKHEKHLNAFDANMIKLKETKLHPALIRPGKETLADFVPESKLKKWCEECSAEHYSLVNFVNELDSEHELLQDRIEQENQKSQSIDVDFNTLRSQFRKANDIAYEVSIRLQIFTNDYQRVKQLVEQAKQKDVVGSYENFEDVKNDHAKYLAQMTENDKTMKSIMGYTAQSKTRLSQFIHERLRSIAVLQSNVKGQYNKILLYNEALTRQKTAFGQLVYVSSMPSAYRASLDEVSRRRKFGKLTAAFMNKINGRISKLREEEAARRHTFLTSYGRFIPRDLIPGLTQELPSFDLQLATFDHSLPNIVVDIPGGSMSDEEELFLLLSTLNDNSETSKTRQELERENERLMNQIKMLSSSQNLAMSPPKGVNYEMGFNRSRSQSQIAEDNSAEYKQRIEQLEGKLGSMYNQLEKSEVQVRQYKSKCEAVELQLADSTMRQSETSSQEILQRQMQDQKSFIEALESRLLQTEKSLRSAMQTLSDVEASANEERLNAQQSQLSLERKITNLEQEITERRERETLSIEQLKDYDEETTSLRREIHSLNDRLSAVQLGHESGEQRTEELQSALDKAMVRAREVEEASFSLKEEISRSKGKISSLTQELQKVTREATEKQGEIEELRERQEESVTVEAELRRRIAELESQISEAQEIQREVETLLNESRSKTKEATSQREEEEKRWKREREEEEKRKKEREEASEREGEEKRRVMREMEALQKKYNEEIARHNEDRNRITQLTGQLDNLQRDHSDTLSKSMISSQMEKTSQEETQRLNRTIEQMREDHAKALTEKTEQNKTEMASFRDKYLGAVKLLETYRKTSEEAIRVKEQVEEEKKRVEEEKKRVEEEKKKAEEEKKRMTGEVENLKREMRRQSSHSSDMDAILNALNQKSEDLKVAQRDVQNERDSIKALQMALSSEESKSRKLWEENENFKFMLQSRSSDGMPMASSGKPTISKSKFKVNDWMLFLPKGNGHYEAWNTNTPRYFLSPAVLEMVAPQSEQPILAQAIEILPLRTDSVNDAFGLPSGTDYHEVTAVVDEP